MQDTLGVFSYVQKLADFILVDDDYNEQLFSLNLELSNNFGQFLDYLFRAAMHSFFH